MVKPEFIADLVQRLRDSDTDEDSIARLAANELQRVLSARCKTCKFWVPPVQLLFGKCDLIPSEMEDVLMRDDEGRQIQVLKPGIDVTAVCDGFDSANLYTLPGHGCTLHQSRS